MPCIEKRLSRAKSNNYKEFFFFNLMKITIILKNNKIITANREKSCYLTMSNPFICLFLFVVNKT